MRAAALKGLTRDPAPTRTLLSLCSFYRGFIPCIARSFPANGALLLTVYQLNNMGVPWG